MNEMFGYIFSNLKSSEVNIWHIQKDIRRQAKFNKTLGLLTIFMSMYIIAEEIHNREQDQRIKKITNEMREIKSTKGD